MNMKAHILAALREQLDAWEALLAGLSEAQITAPLAPPEWRIQDVIVHLWGWQQLSMARVEAALAGREPVYPQWAPGVDPEAEGSADLENAWFYQTYHERPWSKVHQDWREGFLRFLEASQGVSERDLLDTGRYAWLEGYSLAFILVASYDHHQEHLEKLQARLKEQG